MTTPHPATAWAVYDPDGVIVFGSIEKREQDAIRVFKAIHMLKETWPNFRKMGYRCLPVAITPEKKG